MAQPSVISHKPRLHLPGGLYHVILHGNDRQDIFLGTIVFQRESITCFRSPGYVPAGISMPARRKSRISRSVAESG